MEIERKRKHTITQIRRRSRSLRRKMTPVEKALWERLKDGRLEGLKFKALHTLGLFTVDFCCLEHGVVIEIEGDSSDPSPKDRETRAEHLTKYGYRILRFDIEQVLGDMEGVLSEIKAACLQGEG